MRSILFVSVCIISTSSVFAQPAITSDNLPNAGDLLIQLGASIVPEANLEATGADFTWDFETAVSLTGTTTETNCLDITATPFVYQVFFNSPFDPEHNSDFAIGVDAFGIAGFNFEDVYAYYQNRSDRYAITGRGATFNSVPTGAQGEPVDIIYYLPIEYADQDETYSELTYSIPTLGAYNTQQTRSNFCDGWGTINMLGQSFEVLRMRTVINATDSVYIELIGQGLQFERPESIEYRWLSPEYNVPILEIITTGGVPTSVLVADFAVGVNDLQNMSEVKWDYVPARSVIQLIGGYESADHYMIYETSGKLAATGQAGDGVISVEGFAAGLYVFSLVHNNVPVSGSFVR